MDMKNNLETAIFGAGCFWGVEEEFANVAGVKKTEVGFSGGITENPSYKDVCTGETGHAEVVRLEYDPREVSYQELLKKFFEVHDPIQVNRQGFDFGSQYRSVIFYITPEQKETAEKYKKTLAESGKYKKEIATEISPAGPFYRAEEYHQRYLQKKGLKVC
ncbi:peptide-methionine (S)-S-oxide reductase MsrA [bacterium]|nr:peptide-methionine (S)-S-oxide reductase MsrA [bacterium]MCI0565833.1 peptide-methionine (S)-S-oxide reductase MsrA [bacterium]MCI0680292.1 peptide-methionine (S)-S-oxide reductase MsrA [bacterium]